MTIPAVTRCGTWCQLADAKREIKALTDNVTALQERLNDRLVLQRIDRALEEDLALAKFVLELAWALKKARIAHPEGANLAALVSEVGEVADAMLGETPEREREELIDVAVVALRLALGERKKPEVT